MLWTSKYAFNFTLKYVLICGSYFEDNSEELTDWYLLEHKLPHSSPDLAPQGGPIKLLLSPRKRYFALSFALLLPPKMRAIFKLGNGEEKVDEKTKKWENSKGSAWKKTPRNCKMKQERKSKRTRVINNTHYQSINYLLIDHPSIIYLSIIYLLIIYVYIYHVGGRRKNGIFEQNRSK